MCVDMIFIFLFFSEKLFYYPWCNNGKKNQKVIDGENIQ